MVLDENCEMAAIIVRNRFSTNYNGLWEDIFLYQILKLYKDRIYVKIKSTYISIKFEKTLQLRYNKCSFRIRTKNFKIAIS